MRKKKILRLKTKYLLAGIIFGVVFGLGIGLTLGLKKFKSVADPTIPPYYESQAFVKPSDVNKHNIAYSGISAIGKIKIPIIMYHYVEYVKDIGDFIRKRLSITPNIFESQLITLKDNKYDTYFVKDVPDILDGRISYSTRSAILTFDDGYEDFYYDVFPLLKKYQIKATVYIICDFIGRRGFLNSQQIKELVNSDLVEIGSHTLDHFYLKQASPNIAFHQIADCKTELEKDYGIKVQTFAYPYGAFSEEAIDLVKKASYSAAVSVIPGTIQSKENLFYLYRVRAGQFSGQNMVKILEKAN